MSHAIKKGIAVMREFHSKDGLGSVDSRLENLSDTAVATLGEARWTAEERKTFIMVLLRTAAQLGRTSNN